MYRGHAGAAENPRLNKGRRRSPSSRMMTKNRNDDFAVASRQAIALRMHCMDMDGQSHLPISLHLFMYM